MQLPTDRGYIVIGDVHGCIDELKLLLRESGFEIDSNGLIIKESSDKSIVLLGDFIDKGSYPKLRETIQFIYKNYFHLNGESQRFYLIKGNHEEMVYRYLTNAFEMTPERLEEKLKYYNLAILLEEDRELRVKFLKLYRELFIWLKYSYSKDFSVTLTHAPCEMKYLAQDDEVSHRKMVKSASRSKNRGVPLDKLLPYIMEEAEENTHYHIFGHLSQPNIRKFKNRVCIDTSAIYGVSLSCAILEGERLHFKSVPFLNMQKPAPYFSDLLFANPFFNQI